MNRTLSKNIIWILVGIFTIFLLIDYSSASGNERQKVHNKEEGVKVEEQKENLNKSEEKNESIEKEFVNKKVGSEVAKHFQSLLQIKKEDGNLLLDFTLNNISKEDLTLTFTSGQLYDFLVFNKDNNLIYQWSEGRFFTMGMKDVMLEPGDQLKWSTSWDFENQIGKQVSKDEEYLIEFLVTAQVEPKVSPEELISREKYIP
jgi:Intracellular proteinase inhibitor